MKSTFVIGLFLFCATAVAQTSDIHVTTGWPNDTTTFIQWTETANCMARFAIAVTVDGSEITIIETDTIAGKAFCNCEYNLWAGVRGLQNGSWRVTVLRQELKLYGYPEDKQFVVGTTTFEELKSYPLAFSAKVFQSSCLGTYMGRRGTGGMMLSSYPNPAKGDVTVKIYFPNMPRTWITTVIFDALGRRIEPGFTAERLDMDGVRLHLPASLFTHGGLYYCSVTTDDETKTLPFMIMK